MKRMAIVAVTLMLLTSCTHDDEPDPKEYLSDPVVIGVSDDVPGWADNRYGFVSGFEPALGNWLGNQFGFKPVFAQVNAAQRVTVLKDKKHRFKMVIANFSITDERRNEVDFVGPYFRDVRSVLVRKETTDVNAMVDLLDKVVCVTSGSTGQIHLDGVRVYAEQADALGECIVRLVNQDVMAVYSDRGLLETFYSDHQSDLRLTEIKSGMEHYGIGIPNNRPRLCQLLTDKLKIFIDEAWDEKFSQTLQQRGLNPTTLKMPRKPESNMLNSCDDPERVAGMSVLGVGSGQARAVVAVRRRRGRDLASY